MTDSGIDVFDYLDYRAYLRDYYIVQKSKSGLSFRSFARTAGLRSPNYLKLVIDAQRNLTPATAKQFAKALSLTGDARQYFLDLVLFNQVKGEAERAEAYAKLTGLHRYRKAHPLEEAHAEYHSTWYIPAIRELAAARCFRADPAWLAKHLIPPIKPAEAAHALDTLVRLGLLRFNDKGELKQGEAVVTTGPETATQSVISYHRAMMRQASESIDLVEPDARDISSLTLCVGPDGLRRLKERVVRFRRELVELALLEDSPSQVMQLNFQLFPLSEDCDSK
jgi:uncharacterized protein (TIGR02147 family)